MKKIRKYVVSTQTSSLDRGREMFVREKDKRRCVETLKHEVHTNC